jgi:hypothetical protein
VILVRLTSPFLAALAAAVLAVPASAQSEAAPGQNSGLTEYLEAVPSSTGNRSPSTSDPKKARVDPRTKAALAARGDVGERVLGMAASPDYQAAQEQPARKSAPKKQGKRRSSSGSAAPSATDAAGMDGRARSGSSAVAAGLGGGGTGLGLALPLILFATSCVAFALWFGRRRSA